MLLVWRLMFVLVRDIFWIEIKSRKKHFHAYLASTAMHAVENNYRTVLIEDACRGVNEKEIEAKRTELNETGCIFVDSNVVSGKFFF